MSSAPAPGFDLRRNLRLFSALGLVRDFSPLVGIWVVYLTGYRHLTLFEVGVIDAVFWAVKLAAQVPGGALADRYGRRLLVIAGTVTEALGVVAFGFASGFGLLLLSYLLWAIGMALRTGSNDQALLYDSLATGGRQREFGDRFGTYQALATAGALTGGVLGGFIASAINLRVAVLVAVIPYAPAVAILLAMREPPRSSSISAPSTYLATITGGLGAVRRDAALRYAVIYQVMLSAFGPVYFLLAQPFMSAHHVPLALFGVLGVPVRVVDGAAAVLSGRIARRVGLGRTLGLALVAMAAGVAVLTGVDHVLAFAGFALAFPAISLALPALGGYVNDRTDTRVRATVLSLTPLGTSFAFIFVSVAGGALAERSLQLAFGALGATVIAASGAAYVAWLRAPAREG
jgi:MFS family permease